MNTLIIAEAGVNHNGQPELAMQLVDAAVAAGADVVKFQTFKADRLATKDAEKAQYQRQTTSHDESHYEMLKRLELSPVMHDELLTYCQEKGIEFMSSGFDTDSLEYLSSLGMTRFKIPSGELTNLPYLRCIGAMSKSVILSSGMSTLEEIGEAISVLEKSGTPRDRITVLQCTTEYPAPIHEANLKAMHTIKEAFGVETGYSDHTVGIEAAIAAVALGASVIEKHFTIDRALPGPDHKASLEPGELKDMVDTIRKVESALGNGEKVVTESELKNVPIARKSLVARRRIEAGELFTENNLDARRPGTGISPMRVDEVVGTAAPRAFDEGELIEL